MNEKLKILSEKLREMSSEDAANWLLGNYSVDKPGCGDALTLMGGRSWQRVDQLRLARHYFKKLPFASSRPYEVFVSFMSFRLFVTTIQEFISGDEEDRRLLLYHLVPVLRKVARNNSDHELIASLVSRLQ